MFSRIIDILRGKEDAKVEDWGMRWYEFCEWRVAGAIYEFKFIAVVFEKDYSLLKQAVGEELGGVRDNESGG